MSSPPGQPTAAVSGRAPPTLEARLHSAAIVESSDDAILSKDLNGIITSWNAGAERIYGYTAAEAIGQPVSMLVPREIENDAGMLTARLRRGERIQHYETMRRTKDGRRLYVSLTISPLRDETGRIVGASTIARDISERKLEQSRWRMLSEIGQATNVVLDPEELLKRLAALLVVETADYAITYLCEGEVLRRVGAAHADPDKTRLVERLTELSPPTIHDPIGPGAVIRDGEPLLVVQVEPEMLQQLPGGDEYRRVIMGLGPVSSIVLPLRARGRTVGAISLAATGRSARRYTEDDLLLGREIADRAALALDNARLYREIRAELGRREAAEESLRRQFGQLRVLYEMSESVGRASGVDEIYTRALDGLRDGLGITRASILLFDGDGVMRFKAWRGLSDGYRAAVEGHRPWTPNAQDPLPITIDDVAADRELGDELRSTILAERIRSMAFIPLVFGGRLLGKFMLYEEAPRSLGEDEIELARTIASTIAFAITRMADESSIREAKEAAERANEAKSQFLSIMSHELRTPLNAVIGYAELLQLEVKGSVNEEQRQQLERIQLSAQHQLDLVDELLAYTRLEAGREEPRLLETDARRVVADVGELIRPETLAKGLELEVDLPDENLTLVTDPARLRQIVLNLAGNATKYTRSGRVTLRAAAEGGLVVIEVSDTGAGIPADKLEYIFEPFTRVDESLTRDTAGTGLGLAIARRLATLLEGDLRVHSQVGAGSTFTLRLPRSPSAAGPD